MKISDKNRPPYIKRQRTNDAPAQNSNTEQGYIPIFRSAFLERLFIQEDWARPGNTAGTILARHYGRLIGIPQINAQETIERIKMSETFPLFVQSMNELQTAHLYVSHVHGQQHTERVSIMSYMIGLQQRLSTKDLVLCLEISKYHDVGRRNEGEDALHGLAGAGKIDQICEGYTKEERGLIAAVVAAHSVPDDDCTDIFRLFEYLPESQYPRSKLFLNIIKDADALDRLRLSDESLNVDFLRLEFSMRLVRAACEFVQASIRF